VVDFSLFCASSVAASVLESLAAGRHSKNEKKTRPRVLPKRLNPHQKGTPRWPLTRRLRSRAKKFQLLTGKGSFGGSKGRGAGERQATRGRRGGRGVVFALSRSRAPFPWTASIYTRRHPFPSPEMQQGLVCSREHEKTGELLVLKSGEMRAQRSSRRWGVEASAATSEDQLSTLHGKKSPFSRPGFADAAFFLINYHAACKLRRYRTARGV